MDDKDDLNKVEEAAVKYGKFMSPEDYLNWEFEQDEKHEYIDGEIRAMAGALLNHNFIQANLIGLGFQALAGKPCNIIGSDLKVFVQAKKSFFYPDATILCGEAEFEDKRQHVVRNPTVVFEILSSSTREYDLGKKFFFYMQLDSVKEIIMIDSGIVEVKIGKRQADKSWKVESITDINEILIIESVGIQFSLKDIYDNVVFK
jgi:Uma2 family endonuclease